jgi:hypothetical protein
MTGPFESGEQFTQPPKRQCWECLRRRLVCDFALPSCKKCQKAGRDCPGYNPQKPLQWIAPGKVTSRRRKTGLVPSKSKVKSNSAEAQKAVELNQRTGLRIKSAGRSFEDHVRALAVTDENEDVDVGVEELPRREWDDKDGANPQALSQASTMTLSYREELMGMPRFELTNETYDVVQAVHYCKSPLTPASTPASSMDID